MLGNPVDTSAIKQLCADALARALLKDPPILVLDEATSMFDPAGEEAFLALSKDILRERTVLLITHRPASLALADRVLHMDGGRVRPDTRSEMRPGGRVA